MTKKDLERVERFVRWFNEKQPGTSLSVGIHSAPIGKLKASNTYQVEAHITDSGRPFLTAKPKDKRLKGLTFFD